MKVIPSLCLLCIGLASSSPAQSVFQAYLSTPPEGGARLSMGKFWFQVANGEVEFMAIVHPFGPLTGSFDPMLSVPGSSLEFSLGEGVASTFHGSRTIADRNPFLPPEPWLPSGYDEDGNPYWLDVPMIRYGDVYTGRFDLPAGFEAELLAGRGTVEFNSFLSGTVTVAAVPEPAVLTLGMLGAVGLLLTRRRQRSKASTRERCLNH